MNEQLVRDYLIEQAHKHQSVLIPRDLKVSESINAIISIIGPRRAGKTFYFYQLISKNKTKSLYLNFEDPRLLDIKFIEIRDLIRKFIEIFGFEPEFIFFDELQNVDRWESALRELFDLQKYHLYITGSSSKLLSREIATALRGRTLTYTLLPFSFHEFLKAKSVTFDFNRITQDDAARLNGLLKDYLEFGGFPDVVLLEDKIRILKEYYDLILFKDLVERHNLKNIGLAKFLLSFFTQNFSKEITINKISNYFKSQGVSFGKNTLYDYVDKIQDCMSIFFISRYSNNIYVRESWPKKVYICDNGLSKLIKSDESIGKLMENAVFLELLRRKNLNPLLEIFYFHENSLEIDFVLKQGIQIIELIQVCFSLEDLETKNRETKALIKASEILKCDSLTLINWIEEKEEHISNKKIKFIPLWKWLLE